VEDQIDVKRPPPLRGNRILKSVMEKFPAVDRIAGNDTKALGNPEGVNIHREGAPAQAVQHYTPSRLP